MNIMDMNDVVMDIKKNMTEFFIIKTRYVIFMFEAFLKKALNKSCSDLIENRKSDTNKLPFPIGRFVSKPYQRNI